MATSAHGYSLTSQSLPLIAIASSNGSFASEGTITFSVVDAKNNPIGTPVSANVNPGGQATVNYVLPAALATGAYTVKASYADSLGNFQASTALSRTLTVTSATSSVAATGNFSATISPTSQTVALSAAATSHGFAIPEGTVTFSLLGSNNSVIGSATTGTVGGNGIASVNYVVPAGLAKGTYTVQAVYHDSLGNFADSTDATHSLTIFPASVATSVAVTSNLVAGFSPTVQSVIVNAKVTSAASTVSTGTVTISLLDSNNNPVGTATTVNVNANGQVSVSYPIPANQAAGRYTIKALYDDATRNFADSTDTSHTLTINPVPAQVAVTGFTPLSSYTGLSFSLTASVTSNGAKVTTGTVTFTVLDNLGNLLATSPVMTVGSNGQVGSTIALPPGHPFGLFTVKALFHDASGKYSDNTATVTETVANPIKTFYVNNFGLLYEQSSQGGNQLLAVNIQSISSQGFDANGHAMIDVVRNDGMSFEYHDGTGWVSLQPYTYKAEAGNGVSYILYGSGLLFLYNDATQGLTYLTSNVVNISAGTDKTAPTWSSRFKRRLSPGVQHRLRLPHHRQRRQQY